MLLNESPRELTINLQGLRPGHFFIIRYFLCEQSLRRGSLPITQPYNGPGPKANKAILAIEGTISTNLKTSRMLTPRLIAN